VTGSPSSRGDEIAANLAEVRTRIAAACEQSGREPDEVTLVVVTKFFPASDVRLIAGLGVEDVGENRQQEAEGKYAECRDLPLRWHFIGTLQSNKASAVARFADVVESVDRAKLLPGLTKGAEQAGKVLDCLVQVNLDDQERRQDQPRQDQPRQDQRRQDRPREEHRGQGRGGADPNDVLDLAERVTATPGLRLRGLMGVGPLDGDPVAAFTRLAELAASVRTVEPAASWLSAGMSGDLEAAISAGATHVRIGRAILGARSPLR
jgi:PLP dependent protein